MQSDEIRPLGAWDMTPPVIHAAGSIIWSRLAWGQRMFKA